MPYFSSAPTNPPARRGPRLVIWALSAGGIVAVAIVVGTLLTVSANPEQATPNERVAAAVDSPASSIPVDGPGSTASDSSDVESAHPAEESTGASSPAEPGAVGAGVEVLPLDDESSALPPSAALPDLLENTAPTPSSAKGRLVAGLPAIVGPAPKSTVVSSAVTANGETVTATLTAESPTQAAAILAHYAVVFGAVGLTGTPATSAAGDTVQMFYRGNNSVSLTIGTVTDGTTPYAISGLFSVPST